MAKSTADENYIKFDEVGLYAFASRMPAILEEAGFRRSVLQILSTYCTGIGSVVTDLLQTPSDLTRDQFECNARLRLGFPTVAIFGTLSITPSMKQVVTYVPFYSERAKLDGQQVGLDLTLRHFSDGLMETAHKRPKEGNYLFSGGRQGCINTADYQTQVTNAPINVIRPSHHRYSKCTPLVHLNINYSTGLGI